MPYVLIGAPALHRHDVEHQDIRLRVFPELPEDPRLVIVVVNNVLVAEKDELRLRAHQRVVAVLPDAALVKGKGADLAPPAHKLFIRIFLALVTDNRLRGDVHMLRESDLIFLHTRHKNLQFHIHSLAALLSSGAADTC